MNDLEKINALNQGFMEALRQGDSGTTKYTDTLDVLRQQNEGSWAYLASAWNSADGF